VTNNEAEEITMLSVIPPLDFPLSFSTRYVPWSPSPAHGNFTMERHWTMIFNPYSILFYFAIYCHLLYWFLPPVYPGSVRGIFTMQQHWATTSPSCCCVLDYLFINQLTFFPSLHFTHVSVLLCLAITQVRIPFIMERLLLSLAALTTTLPSIQTLATTLADTILVRLFAGHTFPCINSILGLQAFFWILEP